MTGRAWSPDDHEYLVESYGDVPVERIAARVGRTVSAVHNRANAYRLGPNRPHDVMTLNQVLQVLGEMGCHTRFIDRGTGLIDRGILRARRAHQYGRVRPVWWITEADLIAFLREYPHHVDKAKVQPPYRQHVSERWITLSEAFQRGGAYILSLEHAVKAGCLPEARNHGLKGSKWVIPESILPRLIEGRRRFVDDRAHRRLVLAYRQAQARKRVKDIGLRLAAQYKRDAVA